MPAHAADDGHTALSLAGRLYPLCHLACTGLRRGELDHLDWADLGLATRRLPVRGEVESGDGDRIITGRAKHWASKRRNER